MNSQRIRLEWSFPAQWLEGRWPSVAIVLEHGAKSRPILEAQSTTRSDGSIWKQDEGLDGCFCFALKRLGWPGWDGVGEGGED